MSLLYNMLPRLVITVLFKEESSWLQSPSAVILEPPQIKSVTVSIVSPSISYEVMGPDAMILVFWMLSFKPTFSRSSFTFISRLFSSSSLSVVMVVLAAYLRLLIFLLAILIPACSVRHLVIPSEYPAVVATSNYHPSHCLFTPPFQNCSVLASLASSNNYFSCPSDSPSSFWMFPGYQITFSLLLGHIV